MSDIRSLSKRRHLCRNFTNFYGVQLIIKITHTGSIQNITRYEYVLCHKIMYIENQSLKFQFSRCGVAYLECSKEAPPNSDRWVKVRPMAMEGKEQAVVIFRGTKCKQEMRVTGRVQLQSTSRI